MRPARLLAPPLAPPLSPPFALLFAPLRWPFLALLLASLLLAPVLGQIHAVVHAGVHDLGDGRPVAVAAAAPDGSHAAASALLDLFAGHDKAGDCRLYDQASHGDQHAGSFVLALPPAVPALVVAFAAEHVAARRIAPSCARGPPAFR